MCSEGTCTLWTHQTAAKPVSRAQAEHGSPPAPWICSVTNYTHPGQAGPPLFENLSPGVYYRNQLPYLLTAKLQKAPLEPPPPCSPSAWDAFIPMGFEVLCLGMGLHSHPLVPPSALTVEKAHLNDCNATKRTEGNN